MDRSQAFMSVVQRAGTGYQNNLPKWQAELAQVVCKNAPDRGGVFGRVSKERELVVIGV